MTSTATLLSRGLLGVFVATVTLWYFLSPYGVRPHPQFQLDMEKFIEKNRPVGDTEGRWVENWTKWKLQLGGEGGPIILPHQRLSLENLSLPASAVFEWRSDYQADLVETKEGDLEVITNNILVMLIIAIIIIVLVIKLSNRYHNNQCSMHINTNLRIDKLSTKVVIRHPVASIGLYHHYNVKASISSVCDETQN